MKWEKCIFIDNTVIGQDELGNDITADKEVQTAFCRFAPFTETDLKLEGRAVTKNSRKVLVRKSFNDVVPCEKMNINGLLYEIKEKFAAGRFSLFYVERMGAE